MSGFNREEKQCIWCMVAKFFLAKIAIVMAIWLRLARDFSVKWCPRGFDTKEIRCRWMMVAIMPLRASSLYSLDWFRTAKEFSVKCCDSNLELPLVRVAWSCLVSYGPFACQLDHQRNFWRAASTLTIYITLFYWPRENNVTFRYDSKRFFAMNYLSSSSSRSGVF